MPRLTSYTITAEFTKTYTLQTTITAESEDEAEAKAEDIFEPFAGYITLAIPTDTIAIIHIRDESEGIDCYEIETE